MDSGTWIAVYIPVFILIFVILPQQHFAQKSVMLKNKKKRSPRIMVNELIKKYIGKSCKISGGSFGTSITGKILQVHENWIEVETKKGVELVNAEFVQSIKVSK